MSSPASPLGGGVFLDFSHGHVFPRYPSTSKYLLRFGNWTLHTYITVSPITVPEKVFGSGIETVFDVRDAPQTFKDQQANQPGQ